jgi:hypothetical protein
MAGCCVFHRASAQERLRKNGRTKPRRTNITAAIFPTVGKTALRKPVNEERLLYYGPLTCNAIFIRL